MARTLLLADSFDICEFQTSALKYPGASLSAIFQGTIQPGVNSTGARSIDNTGGAPAELPRLFGTQSIVLWHEHIQINATSFTQQTFLIIGASGTPLLQLQVQNDGTIQLLDGSGSLLGTTPALALDSWYWLELNAVYGTSGEFEVWLGPAGSSPTRVIHGMANLTSTFPDRFTTVWSSPSAYRLREDNLQVWSATALTDRNGPAAITGQIVGSLVTQGGWLKGAGTSILQAVADDNAAGYVHVPDGHLTYDTTGPGLLSFLPASSPCNGLVLGIAVNLCAKPIDPSPTISGVVRERITTTVLGTQPVVDSSNTLVPGISDLFGYETYQFISMSPAAGGAWNDAQILSANWGAEASGDLELTQVYLEKVYDLTGRAFGCGEASYSF